eukprot:3316867-Pyramimonas_sp.AAC.1
MMLMKNNVSCEALVFAPQGGPDGENVSSGLLVWGARLVCAARADSEDFLSEARVSAPPRWSRQGVLHGFRSRQNGWDVSS